ncbi:MAG: DoxX family protein [Chloroflexota bacterium]
MKNINWKRIGLILVLGFLTLIIGFSGVSKLAGMEEWLVEWERYGYPLWFMYAIGVLQVIGSIMIWIPKTRFWGAALFAVIMIGAAFTHISIGEFLPITQNAILLALSAYVMWINRESIRFVRQTLAA